MKETFLRLPKHMKFIGVGSIILAVATLLPWYADLDSYKIGDEFLGITGPASFVGIAVLLLSGLSLWIFSYHLLERHVPRLPVREAILHLFVAIESLFLLLIVNSIYFHPKFGVNITLKESRFGMTLALIGSVVLLVGGYLQNREEIAEDRETGKLEPLIKMEPRPSLGEVRLKPDAVSMQERPTSIPRPQGATFQDSSSSLRQAPSASYSRLHSPVSSPRPSSVPSHTASSILREAGKSFTFGQGKGVSVKPTQSSQPAPSQQPQSSSSPQSSEPQVPQEKPAGYMIRMDL